jgi:hypothetical protein
MDQQQVIELIPHAMQPITESGNYQFTGSALAFQNSGDSDVKINNFYTIKAGGSLQFSVSNEARAIITGTWNLKFGAGTTQLLEVMLLIPRQEIFANYIQQ